MMLPFLLTLIAFVAKCFSSDLPNYFPKCHIDDPNLNNCILKATNIMRPYIRKGIPEIGIPSFGPLVVSNFEVVQDSSVVNYTLKVWNFTVIGLDNYDFKEIRFDPETMSFEGRLEINSMSVESIYELDGTLLNFPVKGKGIGKAVSGTINGTFVINGKIVKRKGVEYYSPTNMKIRMKIDDGEYYFDGLFDDEALARMTNDMINKNSKMITDGVTSALEMLGETGWMRVMKSLSKAIPYRKLFPSTK